MSEKPTLRLAVFDFDLTLTAHHVYNALSGAQGGHSLSVPPPYARTERGQLMRLAELNASKQYEADGGFALAAFGGRQRLEQLHELFAELRDAGVECMVCSRGLVGSVRWCLDQAGLLPYFSTVFGCSGCFYGYTEYDARLPASAPEPELAQFLGDDELSGWTSKQDLVDRCLQERGLSCDEAIFVDDSASEVASVALTCAAIQVLTPHGMGKRELALLRGLLAGVEPLHGIVSPSCFGPPPERQISGPRRTAAAAAAAASANSASGDCGSGRKSQLGEGRAPEVQPFQPSQSEESSTAVESSTKSMSLDEGQFEEERSGRCERGISLRGAWAEAPETAEEASAPSITPATPCSQPRSRRPSKEGPVEGSSRMNGGVSSRLTPSGFPLAGRLMRSPTPRSCSPAPLVSGKVENSRHGSKKLQTPMAEPAFSSSSRFCWPARSTSSPRLPSPSPTSSAATPMFSCRPGSPTRSTVLTATPGGATPGRAGSPGRVALLTPTSAQPGQAGAAMSTALPGRPSRAWRRSSPTSASAGRLRSPTPDARDSPTMRGVLSTPPHSSPSLGMRQCAMPASASHGHLPFWDGKLSVAPRHEPATASQPPPRPSVGSHRTPAGAPLLHSSGSLRMFTAISLESPGRDTMSPAAAHCISRPPNQGPVRSAMAAAYRGSTTSRGAHSSSPRPASRARAPPPIWVKDQLDRGHRPEQLENAAVEAPLSEHAGHFAGPHAVPSRGGWPRALPFRPQRPGSSKFSSHPGYSDAGSGADGCTRCVSWGSSTRTPSTHSSSPTQPMLSSPGLRKGSRASTPDVRGDPEFQQCIGFLGPSGQGDAKFSFYADPLAMKAQRPMGSSARMGQPPGSQHATGAVPRPIPFMASLEASREIKAEAAAYEAFQMPCTAA